MSGDATLTIVPVNPPGASIRGLMTETPPTVSFPSGWQSVARPTRRAFTEWSGSDTGMELTVPFLLDGFLTNTSVESELNQIETLMFPTFIGPPPICRVMGQYSQSQWSWVLTGIDYGEVERRFSDGARIRQYLTLTFLEWVAADVAISDTISVAKQVAKSASPAASSKAATPPPVSQTATTYTIKAGDTLARIAAKFGTTWKALATKNSIRDPNKLRVGQVLRIK